MHAAVVGLWSECAASLVQRGAPRSAQGSHPPEDDTDFVGEKWLDHDEEEKYCQLKGGILSGKWCLCSTAAPMVAGVLVHVGRRVLASCGSLVTTFVPNSTIPIETDNGGKNDFSQPVAGEDCCNVYVACHEQLVASIESLVSLGGCGASLGDGDGDSADAAGRAGTERVCHGCEKGAILPPLCRLLAQRGHDNKEGVQERIEVDCARTLVGVLAMSMVGVAASCAAIACLLQPSFEKRVGRISPLVTHLLTLCLNVTYHDDEKQGMESKTAHFVHDRLNAARDVLFDGAEREAYKGSLAHTNVRDVLKRACDGACLMDAAAHLALRVSVPGVERRQGLDMVCRHVFDFVYEATRWCNTLQQLVVGIVIGGGKCKRMHIPDCCVHSTSVGEKDSQGTVHDPASGRDPFDALTRTDCEVIAAHVVEVGQPWHSETHDTKFLQKLLARYNHVGVVESVAAGCQWVPGRAPMVMGVEASEVVGGDGFGLGAGRNRTCMWHVVLCLVGRFVPVECGPSFLHESYRLRFMDGCELACRLAIHQRCGGERSCCPSFARLVNHIKTSVDEKLYSSFRGFSKERAYMAQCDLFAVCDALRRVAQGGPVVATGSHVPAAGVSDFLVSDLLRACPEEAYEDIKRVFPEHGQSSLIMEGSDEPGGDENLPGQSQAAALSRGQQRIMELVWLGHAGCFTPLHCDMYANVLVQRGGVKLVCLLPGSTAVRDLLRQVHGAAVAVGWPSAVNWGRGGRCTWNVAWFEPLLWAAMDNESEDSRSTVAELAEGAQDTVAVGTIIHAAGKDLGKIRKYARRLLTVSQWTVLHPGHALYIPPGWYHWVLTLSLSLSVSHWL